MYRDSVWKLRRTLENYHVPKLVDFRRKCLFINREGVICDYWQALEGETSAYRGEYLPNYDWSFEEQQYLDDIK